MARLLDATKTGSAISAAMLLASNTHAQPLIVADSGDSGWVLAAALIALAGAISGLVAARHAARSGGCIAIGILLFVALGYSLSFGEGSAYLGGGGNLFLANLADLRANTTIPESVFVLFQLALAVFAVAALAAALPDHARTAWTYPFAALWVLIVYVPVARWIWAGWLADLGAVDYAGGIVVQLTAAVGAVVVALLMRGSKARDDGAVLPHFAWIGLGWLAVIGGSALGAGDDAAAAVLNAAIAASAGALVGLVGRGRGIALGALSGLAAASSGAALVGVPGAMVLGIAGALAAWGAAHASAFLSSHALTGAVIAQGVGALTGALLFPVCVLPLLGGPGYDEGASLVTLLTAQAVTSVAVILWSLVATAIAALAVSMIVPMRTSEPA